MTSSDNDTRSMIDDGELKKKILQLGGGELEIWKRSALADKELFRQLYQLTFSPHHKLAWRSCWIIDNTAEEAPELLLPYIPEIVERLSREKSPSMKRHFTRILCRYEVAEEQLGLLVDVAFRLLSPLEAVAVRANAMQILFNIAQREPDLKGELSSVIETILQEDCSAGMVSRGRRILHELSRINTNQHELTRKNTN